MYSIRVDQLIKSGNIPDEFYNSFASKDVKKEFNFMINDDDIERNKGSSDENSEIRSVLEYLYEMGIKYKVNEQYPDAIKYLKDAISLLENQKILLNYTEIYYNKFLSMIYCELGRSSKSMVCLAMEYYDTSLKYWEQNIYTLNSIGVLKEKSNLFKEGVFYLKKAKEINEKYNTTNINLSSLYISWYIATGNSNFLEKSFKYSKVSIENDCKNVLGTLNYVTAFCLDNKPSNAEKLKELLKYYQILSNNFIYLQRLGYFYILNEDLESALLYCLQSLEINPNYQNTHFTLSYIYRKLNFNDYALSFLLPIKNPTSLLNQSSVYLCDRQYSESYDCLLSAIEMIKESHKEETSNLPYFYKALALTLSGMAIYDEAIACLKEALKLIDQNSKFASLSEHLEILIANALMDKKDYKNAIEKLKYIHEKGSTNDFISQLKDLEEGEYKNTIEENSLDRNAIKFSKSLTKKDGKWHLNGELVNNCTKIYNYIAKYDLNNKLIIILGDANRGHYHLAKGGSVQYAGEMSFDNNGEVDKWNNFSGHYKPSSESEHVKSISKLLDFPVERYYSRAMIKTRLENKKLTQNDISQMAKELKEISKGDKNVIERTLKYFN
ncbi:hypothetical protein RB653_007820 [Dictyostelium firmibasis]|uniref:Tetratricopeptide repeat protein n=1 Tax=Dictyostelium firmibasis TaxID=79012 RepID=A0AAN7YPD1_9MYCE